jgi:hypothetical protein
MREKVLLFSCRFLRRTILPTACAAILIVSGCQRNSLPLAQVQGTVSFQGKPLQRGEVTFMPESGTPGPTAIGKIQADGSFKMQTLESAGAAIGRHRVMVHCRSPLTPEEARNLVIPKSLIPEKYSSEKDTPLRFEVKKGENKYRIVLE